MHLLIAAQKAILSNPNSEPEQKERALAELRAIPSKDPRHADAQRVLSEFVGAAVAETAKPEPKPSRTPDKPEKRKPALPMANSMFWTCRNEMQDAVDRFAGELETESERLTRIMSEWATTKDDAILDAFAEAAPAFVERSLDALGMKWEQVQFQLRIWAAIKGMGDSAIKGLSDSEAEKELLQCAEQEATPVLQATALIRTIWPTIKRMLHDWNEEADAIGMDRAAYGRMNVTQRMQARRRDKNSIEAQQ